VFRQDAAAERVDFAKGDGAEPARALQAETEAAYAAEEIKNPVGHMAHHLLPIA
jgi:hypothetical protein